MNPAWFAAYEGLNQGKALVYPATLAIDAVYISFDWGTR